LQTAKDYEILCEVDTEDFPFKAVEIIAKVLADNKDKYSAGSWKMIPVDEHLGHAGAHLARSCCKLQNEPHLYHALCRLAMAVALEKE